MEKRWINRLNYLIESGPDIQIWLSMHPDSNDPEASLFDLKYGGL